MNILYKTAPLILVSSLFALAFSCTKTSSNSNPATEPPKDTTQARSDTAYIKTIKFYSLDSLEITADLYHQNDSLPVMVLCHQAGASRGEYKETAKKLNILGFNCIAIDQRSGGTMNGITNETAKRARDQNLVINHLTPEKDIIAAVNYAKGKYGKKIILLGSSYSSSLVLKIAKENAQVEQVISFSPGEYLPGINLKQTITGLDKPAFLTSSKTEMPMTKILYDVITSAKKVLFNPIGEGKHGASALWSDNSNNQEYWDALKIFLKK